MDPFETALYQHYLALARIPPFPLSTRSASLDFLLEKYDAFFFDAFGTFYNHRHYVYPGAQEMFRRVRASGKEMRLITNAASQPVPQLMEDLRFMGFPFQRHEIFSSGELFAALNRTLGIHSCFYIGHPSGRVFLEEALVRVEENPSENVVAISAATEDTARLHKAEEILKRPGGHLIVLNPDGWAPRINGPRAPVSGACAHQLKLASGCRVTYCGKPFPELFQRALQSLPHPCSTVMIGDTLATDIAGALAAGIDAALIPGRNMEMDALAQDEATLRVRPTYYLL